MPLVALISVIVGITNFVPYFGPFVGAIIGGIFIFLVSPKSLIPFLIMILAIQQLDGNLIGPKILGNTVGLPTVWTLFAIVIGGKLFGIFGIVLGVPIFAVIYTLVKEGVELQLQKKGASDMLEEAGIVTNEDMLKEQKEQESLESGKTGQKEPEKKEQESSEAGKTEQKEPEEKKEESSETGKTEQRNSKKKEEESSKAGKTKQRNSKKKEEESFKDNKSE